MIKNINSYTCKRLYLDHFPVAGQCFSYRHYPNGIIALEFCDNLLRLEAILAKWNIAAAVKIVYLDFFIILSFTSMFYFGSLQIHKYSYRSFCDSLQKGL
jgi:hypothetical protein